MADPWEVISQKPTAPAEPTTQPAGGDWSVVGHEKKDYTLGQAAASSIKTLAPDAVDVVKEQIQGIPSIPSDVWGLSKGLMSKMIYGAPISFREKGKELTEEEKLSDTLRTQRRQRDEKSVNAMIDHYVNTFGSWENFKRELAERPAHLWSDLAPLSGGLLAERPRAPSSPVNIPERQRVIQSFKYETPITQGQISQDLNQLSREDKIRQGAHGGDAQKIMVDHDLAQRESLANAGNELRLDMTGSAQRMTPEQIGFELQRGYHAARNAAREGVSEAYGTAFDPNTLGLFGVPDKIRIGDLRPQIVSSFADVNRPGGHLYPSIENTPNTMRAIEDITNFSRTGHVPTAFDTARAGSNVTVTAVNWELVDSMRKKLDTYRKAAQKNPQDAEAMRRVLDVFDENLGKVNPLVGWAHDAHTSRMRTYEPGRQGRVEPGANETLKSLLNSENPGQAIYNKLFSGATLARGEAGPLVSRLLEIYRNDPRAIQALREGALERLLVNKKDFEALSPVKTGTSIREALNGPNGDIYRALFTPEQLRDLQQYGDFSAMVGQSQAKRNPSGTSYPIVEKLRRYGFQGIGGGVGALTGREIGSHFGAPEVGLGAGAAIGSSVGQGAEHIASQRYARQATRPPVAQPWQTGGAQAVVNPTSRLLQMLGLTP